MLSIAEAVENIVEKTPYLEEALGEKIINLSALARKIHPKVEERVKKEVKTGAIMVALKRLNPKISRDNRLNSLLGNLGDFTVRSNLTEFTFANSETLAEKQKQLFQKIGASKEIICNLSQGVFETTFIVSSSMGKDIHEIFKREKLNFKFSHLSSITIKLPKENVTTPGVYYEILKTLAWNGINLMEVISTSTEIILVFNNEDIDSAFSVLSKSLRS